MKDLYLAIDLGTTNSVVGYGNITKQGFVKCNIIDTDRKTESGGTARAGTLPSVVFYYKDPKTGTIIPEVGDYAKSRYGTKLGYVSRSIKSLMGIENSSMLADEINDKTPAQVSAQILKYLISRSKARLMEEELKDVIITVPASFDWDQCQATIDAAKLAGIETDNVHDILLYEPKAVIYDFINMQEAGEIPSNLINFEEPKNILVFDLGGGTLDVTIHRVGYKNDDMMNIEDIAISRYTKLGGDNFDELLASEMYERFQKMNGVKVPEKRKEEVMCRMRNHAERLKVDMSSDYMNAESMDKDLSEDYYREVYDMSAFDAYCYADEFTPKEVLKVVEPLMGYHMTLADVKRIDSLKEADMNNIIYPILDVLSKAGSNMKIDAVILNGGMTRFFPIKKRIDEFFGLNSLVTSDPDLAVARGAVYYHYCLHKYNVRKTIIHTEQAMNGADVDEPWKNSNEESNMEFNVGTILNDNLNMGLTGEYVSRLVNAGTKLPYVSQEIADKYSFGTYSDNMAIEIFLGRGTTKNLPNRRVADRIISFSKSYPAGTPVSFRVIIDSMRMMRMEAWITGKSQEKAVISIDTNAQRVDRNKTKAAKVNTNEMQVLNAKGELNNFKALSDSFNRKSKTEIIRKSNDIINRISRAANKKDFYGPIYDMLNSLNQRDVLRGYLYAAATNLAADWDEKQRENVLKICKEHFHPSYENMRHDNYVIKEAIAYISNWDKNATVFITQLISGGKYEVYKRNFMECLVNSDNITISEATSTIMAMEADLFTPDIMKKVIMKLEVPSKDFNNVLLGKFLQICKYAKEGSNSTLYNMALFGIYKLVDTESFDNNALLQAKSKLENLMKNEVDFERYKMNQAILKWLNHDVIDENEQALLDTLGLKLYEMNL